MAVLKSRLEGNKQSDLIKRILKIKLDFITNSLNPILESNNEHELKYSILHISAGLELLLKEILRNEHWS